MGVWNGKGVKGGVVKGGGEPSSVGSVKFADGFGMGRPSTAMVNRAVTALSVCTLWQVRGALQP